MISVMSAASVSLSAEDLVEYWRFCSFVPAYCAIKSARARHYA